MTADEIRNSKPVEGLEGNDEKTGGLIKDIKKILL
jgi:hypothetical protein